MADNSKKNEHDPLEEEEEDPRPPPTKKSKMTTTTTSVTMMTASKGASCEGDSGGVPPAESGGVAVVAIPSSIRAVVPPPVPPPPVPPRCKLCQTRPVVRYDLRWFGPWQDLHPEDTALLQADDRGRCAQCCLTLRKLLLGHYHFCRNCDGVFPADGDGPEFYDWSDECTHCRDFHYRGCLVCGSRLRASARWDDFTPSVCLKCSPDENVVLEQEQVEQEQPRQPDAGRWTTEQMMCYYYDDANIPLVFWDDEERQNILITGSYDLLFLTYTGKADQEEYVRRQSRTAVGTVEIWDDPVHPFVAKDVERYGTSYSLQGRGKIDNAFFDGGYFYRSFTFGIQDGEDDDPQPGVGSILDDDQPDSHEMSRSEVTLGWIAQRTALPWIPADCVDNHGTYADRVRRQMTDDARRLPRIIESLLPDDDGSALLTKIRVYLIPPLELALEPGDLCLSIHVDDGRGNEATGKLVARRRQRQRTYVAMLFLSPCLSA